MGGLILQESILHGCVPQCVIRADSSCGPLVPNPSGLFNSVLRHFSVLYSVTALRFLNETNLQNYRDFGCRISNSRCI